jgi:hypothetical protein
MEIQFYKNILLVSKAVMNTVANQMLASKYE